MRRLHIFVLAFLSLTTPLFASAESTATTTTQFDSFTGKITKNKVRLRLQPTFDSAIVKELQKDALLIITGEADDFYAVQPLSDMKAYVFRTYVLDNVIEGTRVNVRLKPDIDAPTVAQLNSGEKVDGTVDASHPKWLEIPMPAATRFYVSKDYVQKMGDATLLARLEKKRTEAERLLRMTQQATAEELEKPFEQMHVDKLIAGYKQVIADHADLNDLSAQAQTQLAALQETYKNKKIAYLESQTQQSSYSLELKNRQLADELQQHKTKLSQLEQQTRPEPSKIEKQEVKIASYPVNILQWMPVEDNLFQQWSKETSSTSHEAFYREQQQKSFILKGIVDAYNRPVKNKPGDYMLISGASKLPIAFLYSTKVNLQDYVGREVSLAVAPRSNNHFAYPAYFVLSIE